MDCLELFCSHLAPPIFATFFQVGVPRFRISSLRSSICMLSKLFVPTPKIMKRGSAARSAMFILVRYRRHLSSRLQIHAAAITLRHGVVVHDETIRAFCHRSHCEINSGALSAALMRSVYHHE